MKKILILALLFASLSSYGQDDIVKTGQPMPDFNILRENGSSIASSSLKGKIVLIDFFATWCGPCKAELPVLQNKIWNKYKDNPNFTFLVIGRDHSDSEVNAFKEKNKYSFPIYADKGKIIYSKFATMYIPRTYLIDKKGNIVYWTKGYRAKDIDTINATIKELLNQP